MSRIHTQMSVLWDTKCHRVQTLFVIGVTITLVTSCWMRVFSLFPICFSQQLGAINPALLLPPSYKEGRACGYPPKILPAAIHRAAEKGSSREPGFRYMGFSAAQFPTNGLLGTRPLYGARLQSDAFSGHLASVVRKSVEESSVRFLRRRFEQQPLPPPHPKPLSTSSSQPVPLRSLDVSLGFELARWSTRCPPPQPLRRSRGEALWPCSLLASLSPSCAAKE